MLTEDTSEETYPTDIILMLFDHLKMLGIDPQAVCQKVGVPFTLFQNQNQQVTSKQGEDIWQEAIVQSRDINFGLHFGKSFQGHAKGHILVALISNSPTMAVALKKIVPYHVLLHGKSKVHLQITEYEDLISCRCDFKSASPAIVRHFVESFFTAIVAFTRHLSNSSVVPHRINFRHEAPVDLSDHRALLKAPLFFEQKQNELIYQKEALSHPIPLANPEFFQIMENHIKNLLNTRFSTKIWTEKVASLFGKSILTEPTTLEEIAKKLAVSPRTLQGKLKKEGQSFQNIKDQVRKEIAIDYLKGADEGICDIAFLLGFTEQSTFTKAFKQWTGLPPKQYRVKYGHQ